MCRWPAACCCTNRCASGRVRNPSHRCVISPSYLLRVEELEMTESLRWIGALLLAFAMVALLRRAWARLLLSRAKHRSLAGHPRWARRLARALRGYEFSADDFFGADGAPQNVQQQRRGGFEQLAALYSERFAATRAASAELGKALADVDFTSRYRVPFQFSRILRERLSAGSMLRGSAGRQLIDLDGNALYDLTGS